MLPEQNTSLTVDCHCCRLVRTDRSSRLLLPLARRGRPHLSSSRSHRLLCPNCLKIKHKQENDILDKAHDFSSSETNSKNIFQTITDLNPRSTGEEEEEEEATKDQMIIEDIPHEIEFSLMNENEQIQSSETLVWRINTSNNVPQANTIAESYDTGSLTNDQKKLLLQEAVEKLQIVLRNRSTTTSIPDSDLDKIEFTYRALQTTVDILSSSLDSL